MELVRFAISCSWDLLRIAAYYCTPKRGCLLQCVVPDHGCGCTSYGCTRRFTQFLSFLEFLILPRQVRAVQTLPHCHKWEGSHPEKHLSLLLHGGWGELL